MHSLDFTQIVKIASILVVRSLFRECGLHEEASCLFVEVLVNVRPQNDVHDSCLPDLIMLQAACFVDLEHKGSYLREFALLFINNCNHIHGLGCQVIKSAQVNVLQSEVDEVTELLCILEIAIVDELHEKKIIEKELSFRELHNFVGTGTCGMQLSFNCICDGSGLHWKLQSSV